MQSAAESGQLSYLLPVIFGGIVKGELGNPGRVNPGNNFQALHDTLKKPNMSHWASLINIFFCTLTVSCSSAEYSPSICSRMMTVSMFVCLHLTPGRDLFICDISKRWDSIKSDYRPDVHNVGEEVELTTQLHVESLQLTSTAVVGSGKDALDADAVPGDGASNILKGSAHQLVHFAEEKGFKVDWDSSGLGILNC
jgi:hypothetical protein